MLSARLVGTVAVLALLCACPEGRGDPTDGPRLPTIELTPTTVGVAYETQLSATGGAAPLTYSLVGQPPPGFTFNSADAKLTGPGTESGEFNLTVSVRDAVGSDDTHTWTMKVWPAPVLGTEAAPGAVVGTNYSYVFACSGGRPPLRWSVANGQLPSGLSLSTEGILSGVPQGRGLFNFTLRVQDASGATSEAWRGLEVVGPGEQPDAGPPPNSFPLSVGNWNIEWFGDTTYGPSDDPLQLSNAQAVLADAGVDFWGLGEIVSTPQFNELKARLPGYDGFLSDDSVRVSSGTGYYTPSEQKLGVLFKSGVVKVLKAEVILGAQDFDFAGRPPLRVDLRVTRGSSSVDLTAIVVHLKALAGTEEYQRRMAAAGWLKSYMDANLPTQRAMIVGDWNDDVDVSTTTNPDTGSKYDTPFRNFVNDTERYTFITQAMSLAGIGSTAGRNTFIDHQLATNEMASNYVANSAQVLRPAIASYSSSTSDHYPVISRYDFGQAARALKVTAPNGGETLTAGTTYAITWTATGVDTVKLQYSVDNGTTWRDVVASVSAATGRYTWTVPSDNSGGARVRVVDTRDATFFDASDSTFVLNHASAQVIINEYLPQPNNAPGTTTPDYDQMFVEVLNTGSTAVDISGWKLHDDKSYSGAEPVRHVFPAGTVLQPGKAYVVYGGASAVPSGVSNVAYASGGDGLRFNRGVNVGSSGDTVYLVLPDGTVQDSNYYRDTYQGTSYNRSPDASGTGTWVLHTTLSSTLTASPGKRANGSAF
ncbi:lamin tail domain-containing protein [Pyxidicoccus parkwayensis]|uniref:lamin tail domain-containing protein n=1 Tax=Pyxidicoccus parkwayensis TaxID=2813578 RepID=UPI001F510FF5|nr:lamin tail domain-containing protein [Pyxidicoccus parkwaysis]